MVVDRREVHAGLGGDVAQRRRGEAVVGEQLLGGIEDSLLGVAQVVGRHGYDSS